MVTLLVAGTLIGFAPSAAASCASPPRPSPYAFTGTVTSVEREGVLAHVLTDDGAEVEVVGSPSETGVTSVDRTFKPGVRYEFHPLNDSSPYQDNSCTATRELEPASGFEAAMRALSSLLLGALITEPATP